VDSLEQSQGTEQSRAAVCLLELCEISGSRGGECEDGCPRAVDVGSIHL
jgi:hypothetical protein